MDTHEKSGLELEVRLTKEAEAIRGAVIERAKAMLRAVLEAVRVDGKWIYIVVGPGSLPNQSQYRMEAQPGSAAVPNMFHITVRSSLLVGGIVTGMLRTPSVTYQRAFLQEKLLPNIESLNHSGWTGVIEREVRESMRPGGPEIPVGQVGKPRAVIDGDDEDVPVRVVRPALVDGPTALRRERERLGLGGESEVVRVGRGRIYQSSPPRSRVEPSPPPRPPSARALIQPGTGAELARLWQHSGIAGPGEPRALPRPPAVPVLPRGVGVSSDPVSPVPAASPAAKRQGDVSMATKKPLEDQKQLGAFLIAALRASSVKNGVLTTSGVTTLVGQHFSRSDPQNLVGPLFAKLKKLGWVLHVGYGEFQATQSFIDVNRLDIAVEVLPEYRHGGAQPPKAVRGNGVSHQLSLEELLQNRARLEADIREAVLREQSAREQTIADLEHQLAEAKSGLAHFQEQHAELISQARAPAETEVKTSVLPAAQAAPH